MKNISRRVFIKGMAVAAVATAASTVLTGCKLPTGTTEEPVVDATTQSFTVVDPTDSKKTLVVTAEKMEYNSTLVKGQKIAAIDLKLVNDLQTDVYFVDDYQSNKSIENKYQVVVTAYLNDEEGKAASIVTGVDNFTDNLVYDDVSKAAVGSNSTNTVTAYGKVIAYTADTIDWSKVTVKMAVYKVVKNNNSADGKQLVKTGKFSFNV